MINRPGVPIKSSSRVLGGLACLAMSGALWGCTSSAGEATIVETTVVATTIVATTIVATTIVETPAAGVSTTMVGDVGVGATGVLLGLENGDRACYVRLATSSGEVSLPGGFELCAGQDSDATALIGKIVTYRTERSSIASASCEGAPDCATSDIVDLVVQITSTDGSGAALDLGAVHQLEGLPLGTSEQTISELLGEPDARTAVQEEGATGDFVSSWSWEAAGVNAKMSASTADGPAIVSALTITSPSQLRTLKGIAVGATLQEVTDAYGQYIDAETTTDEAVVVGSLYGGLIFTISDGKVTTIFVGAAAE